MRIVVVSAAGWQLAYAGCYGNQWIETPALDLLAAQAVVFDQHLADRPDAVGARRAWRTGCYHLPRFDGASEIVHASADLLALLENRGLARVLVRDRDRPDLAEWHQGWDKVLRGKKTGAVERLPATLARIGAALDELAQEKSWLLWVDLDTLLPPWELPDDYQHLYFEPNGAEEEDDADDSVPSSPVLLPLTAPFPGRLDIADEHTFMRLQRTAAGAVTFFDESLGALLEDLRDRRLLDDLLLFVTSDYGWPLGIHGWVGDALPGLHEERLHVPLICRLPGGIEAGRRVSALTQSVDLMPTLLDAVGGQVPPLHGQSLLALCRGEVDNIRPYACAGLPHPDCPAWALRTRDWLLHIRAPLDANAPVPTPELYVKPDDRWEVNNLWQHYQGWGHALEHTLRAFVDASWRPGPLELPPLPQEPTSPSLLAEETIHEHGQASR
jgi:arylsulfatase A-like enzyme